MINSLLFFIIGWTSIPSELMENNLNYLWRLHLVTLHWELLQPEGTQPYPCDKAACWVHKNRYLLIDIKVNFHSRCCLCSSHLISMSYCCNLHEQVGRWWINGKKEQYIRKACLGVRFCELIRKFVTHINLAMIIQLLMPTPDIYILFCYYCINFREGLTCSCIVIQYVQFNA